MTNKKIIFKMKDTYVTLLESELKNYGYLQILYNNSQNDTIIVDKEEETDAIIVNNMDPMLFNYLHNKKQKIFFNKLNELKKYIDYKPNRQLEMKYKDSCFEKELFNYGKEKFRKIFWLLGYLADLEIGKMYIFPIKGHSIIRRAITHGDKDSNKFVTYCYNILKKHNLYYVPIKTVITFATNEEMEEGEDIEGRMSYSISYDKNINRDKELQVLSESEYDLYWDGWAEFSEEDFLWDDDKVPIVRPRIFDYRQVFSHTIALMKVDPKILKL